jgi:hypothetical protein
MCFAQASLPLVNCRLGIAKVGADIEDWSKWTPEMQARCVADTKITKALWQFLQPDGYPAEALALEHRVARICERITADGVPFDVKAAAQLRQQWTARRAELGAQLSQQFPETNLNSRKQLGALLEARGWIPEERTKKTRQPKITDEVLETIPATFPEFAGLAEYDILRRRLAAEGFKAVAAAQLPCLGFSDSCDLVIEGIEVRQDQSGGNHRVDDRAGRLCLPLMQALQGRQVVAGDVMPGQISGAR